MLISIVPSQGSSYMESRPSHRQDWTPRQVHAALHDAGLTLKQVSIEAGYDDSAAWKALYQYPTRWPKLKRIIAGRIGVPPQEIWPSIFDEQGEVRPGADRRKLPKYLTRGEAPVRRRTKGAA